MQRHPHAVDFQKTVEMEYNGLHDKGSWIVVNKAEVEGHDLISLKWVFTYKIGPDSLLQKYKARLVVRGDLQDIDKQDVYAATLAFRVFRGFMALVAAFGLKTRHLDAINAFLNATNDDSIYCRMPDGWKIQGKVLKVIKALYEQRKSPLL